MVSAALTPDGQDVNATYSISGAPLAVPGAISLYWASGPASADEIGNAVVVPTQTAVGTYAVSVPLTSLGAQPRSATYILAVANSPSTDPDHELVWTASPSNPGGGGASGSQGGVIHATRTALKARPSPANSGQLIGLTATVKRLDRKGGTPGGSVTFLDGTAVLGTVTLRGGRASLTVSSLHVGRNPIRVDYTPDNGFAPSAETIVEIVRPHRPRGKEVSARDAVMPARSESSAASRTTVKGPAIPADAAPASAAPAFLGPLALDEKRAARAAATRPERTTPAVASNSVPIDPLLREQAINQSVQAAAKTPETLLGRG
jgi:Bacterial Ig-like domain (group 3)